MKTVLNKPLYTSGFQAFSAFMQRSEPDSSESNLTVLQHYGIPSKSELTETVSQMNSLQTTPKDVSLVAKLLKEIALKIAPHEVIQLQQSLDNDKYFSSYLFIN